MELINSHDEFKPEVKAYGLKAYGSYGQFHYADYVTTYSNI